MALGLSQDPAAVRYIASPSGWSVPCGQLELTVEKTRGGPDGALWTAVIMYEVLSELRASGPGRGLLRLPGARRLRQWRSRAGRGFCRASGGPAADCPAARTRNLDRLCCQLHPDNPRENDGAHGDLVFALFFAMVAAPVWPRV